MAFNIFDLNRDNVTSLTPSIFLSSLVIFNLLNALLIFFFYMTIHAFVIKSIPNIS